MGKDEKKKIVECPRCCNSVELIDLDVEEAYCDNCGEYFIIEEG